MSDFVIGGIGSVTFVAGAAGNYFRPLHGGQFSTLDGTESPDRETLVDAAYTGVTIRINVSANTNDANDAISLRVNQATSALSASITANTTGEFSDTASVAIVSGDDVAINLDITGDLGHDDSITIDWWTFGYTGTGDSTWISSPNFPSSHSASNRYPVIGRNAGSSSEPWLPAVDITTIDNARAVVTQNNADARTLSFQVNGAGSGLSISIPANTTGLLSDTANSDTAVADDDLDWRLGAGASMTGDTTTVFSVSCRSSVDAYTTIASYNGTINANGVTRYFGAVPQNSTAPTATEADVQVPAEVDETVDRGAIGVNSNSYTAANTFTFRNTGVDTDIVVSVPSGTTGVFQDTVNSHTLAAADDINWKLVAGASAGTLVWLYLSVDLPQQAAVEGFEAARQMGQSDPIFPPSEVVAY